MQDWVMLLKRRAHFSFSMIVQPVTVFSGGGGLYSFVPNWHVFHIYIYLFLFIASPSMIFPSGSDTTAELPRNCGGFGNRTGICGIHDWVIKRKGERGVAIDYIYQFPCESGVHEVPGDIHLMSPVHYREECRKNGIETFHFRHFFTVGKRGEGDLDPRGGGGYYLHPYR